MKYHYLIGNNECHVVFSVEYSYMHVIVAERSFAFYLFCWAFSFKSKEKTFCAWISARAEARAHNCTRNYELRNRQKWNRHRRAQRKNLFGVRDKWIQRWSSLGLSFVICSLSFVSSFRVLWFGCQMRWFLWFGKFTFTFKVSGKGSVIFTLVTRRSERMWILHF